MTRTDLLNELIRQRNVTHYLEVGVGNEQDNFAHINCAHKIGVDPRPVTTFWGSSDAFFAQNQDTFDLIFIDGLHTEAQVLTDVNHALCCLTVGGQIVLHDCLPPDAWHQRDHDWFQEGEAWNGQVWKAALRFFNGSPYRCVVLDTDWGCGLIDTARTQVPTHRLLPTALDYALHFPLLWSYTMSVADYLRDEVTVFYHLACMGNWHEVLVEQWRQLRQNGFVRLKVTILGSLYEQGIVESVAEGLGLHIDIIFREDALTRFETPAMLAIEAHARHRSGYVLYVHSKGVSNPENLQKASWRRLMMQCLVEDWAQTVLYLPGCDAVGVNWRDMGNISHFSGNFWYASTGYLRQLADFADYFAHPRYQIWDAINDRRLCCEFWIGSAAVPARIQSLVCRNEDFCSDAYWQIHPQ